MSTLPDWIDRAIIYQVFPASFYDSNADGIGDLPGLVEKLDYVAGLGANVLWLNPIFDSPFQDAGYDVRDYYRVAPRYGTNRDVTRLCREAARKGLRVMLDLVPGHTSSEHSWFKQSARRRSTKFDNRYVWTDHIFRDAPGPFIGGDTERSGKFLVNFFSFQPALNYGYLRPKEPWQLPMNHPDALATREEIKRIMDFWLRKGVSGFRVDLADSLVKDDENCEGLAAIYSEWRGWLDKHWPDAALLAEWSDPANAIRCGFHMDFLLHATPAYNALFRMEEGTNVIPQTVGQTSYFRRSGTGSCLELFQLLDDQIRRIGDKGRICLPTGNHDLPRISIGRTKPELKVVFGFLLTLPVVPAIYYGDEIGMRHLDDTPNREGAFHRAGCRTPMQWDENEGAGFSKASMGSFYLPLDPSKRRPCVARQEADEDSLLECVRTLTTLRKTHPALSAGEPFKLLHARDGDPAVVFQRGSGAHSLLVALNPSAQSREIEVRVSGEHAVSLAFGSVTIDRKRTALRLRLGPVSFAVCARA